jgi:type IV pilus assembly protein PilN
MIRINLLASDRGRGRKRVARFDQSTRLTVAGLVILVATAAALGFWAWSLRRQAAALDAQIAAAQTQARRLQPVIQQVQRFEKQRDELQQRVALIEELRKGQGAAVHLLDEVSRSLPDLLWLTEMKQHDDIITIDGQCTSLTALSDLVARLEASPYFQKPVELVGSQTQPATAGQSEDVIKFTIKAQLAAPKS